MSVAEQGTGHDCRWSETSSQWVYAALSREKADNEGYEVQTSNQSIRLCPVPLQGAAALIWEHLILGATAFIWEHRENVMTCWSSVPVVLRFEPSSGISVFASRVTQYCFRMVLPKPQSLLGF